MTVINYTTAKRTFKHLTDIQRGRLEEMAKSGNFTQAEMAKELNVSQSTISRELKRGEHVKCQRNELIMIDTLQMLGHVFTVKTGSFLVLRIFINTQRIFRGIT